MAAGRSFAGKATFATPGGAFWTVADDGTVSLGPGPGKGLNLYGSPGDELWLQGANRGYLQFDAAADAYVAKARRDGGGAAAPADLRIEATSGDRVRIAEVVGAKAAYYVTAADGTLKREAVSASPGGDTLFARQQITPGLDAIRSKGALGLDLTNAWLAGEALNGLNFSTSDLSGGSVAGADITGTTWQATVLKGTDFSRCRFDEVTMAAVTASDARFDGAVMLQTSTLAGADLSRASLRGVVARTPVKMNGVTAKGAVFDGADLSDVPMNGSDLTGASLIGVILARTQMAQTNFTEAVMTQVDCRGAAMQTSTFDKATLVGADFTGADIGFSTFRGANLTNAVLDRAAGYARVDLSGALLIGAILRDWDFKAQNVAFDAETNFTQADLDGVNLTGFTLDRNVLLRASMRAAKLDGTSMQGTVLVGADLSFASITGGVSCVGANLSNARLESVDMPGAQFGPLRQVARLDAGAAAALDRGAFPEEAGHAHLLAGGPAHVEVRAPGAHWMIRTGARTLLATRDGDGIALAEAGSAGEGAVLSNVFMPNANLREANLYAVDMSGAQWYGASAKAEAANMELANLSNANVATMDFTQATLYGADLSFANLLNATFRGARLTPTTGSKPASLAFASMQGADFSDAALGGANLTNAAVSLVVADSHADLAGDPVGTLPQSAIQILDSGFLDDATVALLGKAGIAASKTDGLVVLSLGSLWLLRPSAKNAYAQYVVVLAANGDRPAILGEAPTGKSRLTAPEILAVPIALLPGAIASALDGGEITQDVTDAFDDIGYPLVDAAAVAVVEPGRRWAVRNIDPAPTSLQRGYGQFHLLSRTVAGRSTVHLFGGSPVVVVRTAVGNTFERVLIPFGAARFTQDTFNAATVMPSGLKYAMLGPEIGLEFLLSPGLPPKPPACVPSPTTWC